MKYLLMILTISSYNCAMVTKTRSIVPKTNPIHARTFHSALNTKYFQKALDRQGKRTGNTMLHYYVKTENHFEVQRLLDQGATPLIKNNEGLTPLEYARDEKMTNIFYLHCIRSDRFARKIDLDKNYFSRNLKDGEGQTQLHHATQVNDYDEHFHPVIYSNSKREFAQYLLKNGALTVITDKYGFTPYDYALKNKDILPKTYELISQVHKEHADEFLIETPIE